MQHLAVGQYEDLLPGAGHALHIHQNDAVSGKNHLIPHRLVGSHNGLAVQQQLLCIFADVLFRNADKVLHGFVPKFHGQRPFLFASL